MLALPFLSALIIARTLRWEVIPAAIAVVGIFLLREPLVILGRQAFVWKNQRPETAAARWSLAWYAGAVAVSGALLLWRLPPAPMLVLGAGAALLTTLAVWLTVQNRQRSMILQLASAAGLTASAFIAWLAVRADLAPAVFWLWAAQFAHSAGSVMTVHARLEALYGRGERRLRTQAFAVQILLFGAAAGCLRIGVPWPAIALALSALVHLHDLLRLPSRTLRQVGVRELSLSVVFSTLVVYGLIR